MTSRSASRPLWAEWLRPRRLPGVWVVFAGALVAMLAIWFLLALIYSGIGGGTNLAESRKVISAVSSTTATAGNFEAQAILATEEYFAVSSRSSEIFDLDPEGSLEQITTSPGSFDVFDESPGALAVDPERTLPVLVVVAIHEGEMPEPATWADRVRMTVDGQPLSPVGGYTVAFQSEHHQTVALQFPRTDSEGRSIVETGDGELVLSVPNLETEAGMLDISWPLPLDYPEASGAGIFSASAATLGGVLAIMAGLLVVFSPCVVHMTAYFLPVVTGLGMREILDRKEDTRFRAHVALLGIAFVSGFVVLYTAFGVAAGFAGQFFSNTAQLDPYLVPFRVVTGIVVIYLAFHTMGVFRLPFVVSLQLPGQPHNADSRRRGFFGAAIAGMSVSAGCLVCVGGTLLASLLIYAGASSSPLVGGLTLLLFSLGMSMPFLLAAFAFDRALPRFNAARSLIRYSTPVAGAAMLVMGLLILSGNDSIFEQLVV